MSGLSRQPNSAIFSKICLQKSHCYCSLLFFVDCLMTTSACADVIVRRLQYEEMLDCVRKLHQQTQTSHYDQYYSN